MEPCMTNNIQCIFYNQSLLVRISHISRFKGLGLWCLMPLSTIGVLKNTSMKRKFKQWSSFFLHL
jgi:hypothetical protein